MKNSHVEPMITTDVMAAPRQTLPFSSKTLITYKSIKGIEQETVASVIQNNLKEKFKYSGIVYRDDYRDHLPSIGSNATYDLAIICNQEAMMAAIDPTKQAERSAQLAAVIEASALKAQAAAEVTSAAGPLMEKLQAMEQKMERMERNLASIEANQCCTIS